MDLKRAVTLGAIGTLANPTGAAAFIIGDIVKKSLEKNGEAKKEIPELEVEAAREELYEKINEAKARVAQEIAIAERIQYAETVEIEEFYDVSGKGSFGLDLDEGVNIGAKAKGQKVTKRIYKFSGRLPSGEVIDENVQQKHNFLDENIEV